MTDSELVIALLMQMKWSSLPEPEQEIRFHPKRRWRFDIGYSDRKLAVEVEGGSWISGRHTRPAGFRKDCEKYNEAALAGWKVLRVTSDMVHDGTAVEFVRRALDV